MRMSGNCDRLASNDRRCKPTAYKYSIHAFKRSAIERSIAIKRSTTSATQLLFPIQIVMFKRRITVSGAWNWKPRHSA